MKNGLKVLITLVFLLSLMVPQLSLKASAASTDSPSVSMTEDGKFTVDDIYITDNNRVVDKERVDSNTVGTFALVGGGVVSCKGLSKYAECDLNLIALEPISVAVFSITIYKISSSGTKSVLNTFERKKYPSGSSVIEDNFLIKNLSAGNYQISVGGYMYGYSDVPLDVKTFWSGKFTVKN